MPTNNTILILLGLLVAASSSGWAGSAPQAEDKENLVFEDDNLRFPAEDQQAGDENITFSDTFVDSTQENLAFDPVEIPETDFSQAATETEPNEEASAATALSMIGEEASGRSQFAARGTLSGRDTDYFSFSVRGEAQLYLIEASGSRIQRMTLFGAAGKVAEGKGLKQWKGASITGINLPPGEYNIAIEQRSGDEDVSYTLRVVPMGVPDPYMEREPNDSIADAEILKTGEPRRGLLAEPGDYDYYRFSLTTKQRIRVKVQVPPEIRLQYTFYDGKVKAVARTTDGPGQEVEYAAFLPAGDYYLSLKSSDGISRTPYVVTLDNDNRFRHIVDLEPNDKPDQARPVPADGRVWGRARDFGDDDWYAFPDLPSSTTLTMFPDSSRQRLSLHTLDGTKTRRIGLDWSEDSGSLSAILQPGMQYLLQVSVKGDYEFQVRLDPEPTDSIGSVSDQNLTGVHVRTTDELPSFAAFWHESQEAEIPISVRNVGSTPARLHVDVATSHANWSVKVPAEPILIDAGSEVALPAVLKVAPDALADATVQIDVRLRDEKGDAQITSIKAAASCGVPPVNPGRIWTLPDELLGGFNVALTSLGSRIVEASDGSTSSKSRINLYDGMTPNGKSWHKTSPQLPLDHTIELAGNAPIPVAGFILDSQGVDDPRSQVRDFELFLSVDGADFTKVLSGRLSRARIPQEFILSDPVDARFARLRILSTFDLRGSRASLGEFAVVADPNAKVFAGERLNLAAPNLGGYIAWSRPHFGTYSAAEAMLTESVERPSLRFDPVIPTEWVIGFHHDRAAQITELQWTDSPGMDNSPRVDTVQVSVSTEGPAGPWIRLANWELDRSSDSTSVLRLSEPVWARFVRFVVTEIDSANRVPVAETIRIYERDVDSEYRSILGEWGKYTASASFEWSMESDSAATLASAPGTQNSSKDKALRLEADVAYADEVQLGVRTAWYRFEVPNSDNRLRFNIEGNPVANVRATLTDDAGSPVPLEETRARNGSLVLEASVQGGTVYWLQVSEPIRHLAVVWDNSGSVSPYFAAIYGAINKFVREIQPGKEFVQLLPFRKSGFLLDEWSDQTATLMAGLQSDSRKETSSDAETFLLKASTALGAVDGVRAAIIITDAATGSYNETPDLWYSLGAVRPRIFAVELHGGSKPAYQQDMMQSWASVNNGHYTHFSQQSDLDVAFDRAFCLLRRPVRYSLVADSRFDEPPGPGFLSVETGDAISANAVELILDASGSMLQRLEGARRIEIARNVLADLVNETIPEGTMLALRVFGHRKPDACDTDLAVPLQPLDPGKVTGIIQSTQAMNLARTPIGESLGRVADDLKNVEGQKLIILITDGEETCDGDPASAIADLKEAGHDVRINIVGFAIDDAALKAEFESWARMGGGLYFNAGSAAELDEALKEAMRPKFQVLDDTGAIIATGTADSGELELPSGTYTVKILTSPVQTFDEVTIEPEKTRKISATANPEETGSEEKQ